MEFGVNESSFNWNKQNTPFPIRNFLRRQRGRVNQTTNAIFYDEATKEDGCRVLARSHTCAAMEVGIRSACEAVKLIVVCCVRRREANIACYVCLSYTDSSVPELCSNTMRLIPTI